uniref:Uncharacterized protein n=1 Tax=Globodera rostochiensis TaxID=31243 RepID=A0A914IF12_GLORO
MMNNARDLLVNATKHRQETAWKKHEKRRAERFGMKDSAANARFSCILDVLKHRSSQFIVKETSSSLFLLVRFNFLDLFHFPSLGRSAGFDMC